MYSTSAISDLPEPVAPAGGNPATEEGRVVRPALPKALEAAGLGEASAQGWRVVEVEPAEQPCQAAGGLGEQVFVAQLPIARGEARDRERFAEQQLPAPRHVDRILARPERPQPRAAARVEQIHLARVANDVEEIGFGEEPQDQRRAARVRRRLLHDEPGFGTCPSDPGQDELAKARSSSSNSASLSIADSANGLPPAAA